MRAGKFESTIMVGDDEFNVMVHWEGSSDRGDRWTPPDSWMDIIKVDMTDTWPEGLSQQEYEQVCDRSMDRWFDIAWESYRDQEEEACYGAEAL